MLILKSKGRVYGAKMTAAEKKAMDIEIRKQFAEYDRKNEVEINAIVLWVLRTQLKFGPKRLRRFFDRFNPAIKALIDQYEMDDTDDIWLCTRQLKEYGVDVEQWMKESEK